MCQAVSQQEPYGLPNQEGSKDDEQTLAGVRSTVWRSARTIARQLPLQDTDTDLCRPQPVRTGFDPDNIFLTEIDRREKSGQSLEYRRANRKPSSQLVAQLKALDVDSGKNGDIRADKSLPLRDGMSRSSPASCSTVVKTKSIPRMPVLAVRKRTALGVDMKAVGSKQTLGQASAQSNLLLEQSFILGAARMGEQPAGRSKPAIPLKKGDSKVHPQKGGKAGAVAKRGAQGNKLLQPLLETVAEGQETPVQSAQAALKLQGQTTETTTSGTLANQATQNPAKVAKAAANKGEALKDPDCDLSIMPSATLRKALQCWTVLAQGMQEMCRTPYVHSEGALSVHIAISCTSSNYNYND